MIYILLIFILSIIPQFSGASELGFSTNSDSSRKYNQLDLNGTASQYLKHLNNKENNFRPPRKTTKTSGQSNTVEGTAGAILGGTIGAILLYNLTKSDCKEGPADEDKGLCESFGAMGQFAAGALIGLPVGAVLGYKIAVSYSEKNKIANVTTSFRF